jgi:hypothetical protein
MCLFFLRLAHGCLSPRKIYWEIKRYEQERTANNSTYWLIFELLWRDYFRFVALKYGNRLFYLSGIQGKYVPWKRDMETFNAWRGIYLCTSCTFLLSTVRNQSISENLCLRKWAKDILNLLRTKHRNLPHFNIV